MVEPEAPTPLAKRFVRAVLGFGVWVALGLAPFLGNVELPGFAPLLDLYPQGLRSWLIPLSAFLMGAVALTVEFAARRRLTKKGLGRWFRRGIVTVAAALLLLIVLYPFLVTRVPLPDGDGVAFVTGPTLPAVPRAGCECTAAMTREQCIEEVSLNEVNVKRCFGSLQVDLASLVLTLLYLTLTGAFAATVGVLLLDQERERAGRRRRRSK